MGRAASLLARPRFLAAPRTLVSCASWFVASRGIAPRHHFISRSQRTSNLLPGFWRRNCSRGKFYHFSFLTPLCVVANYATTVSTEHEEAQADLLQTKHREHTALDRRWTMKLIEKNGAVAIWEVTEAYGADFYVYDGDKLVRVCPSIGMAREVAAGV